MDKLDKQLLTDVENNMERRLIEYNKTNNTLIITLMAELVADIQKITKAGKSGRKENETLN